MSFLPRTPARCALLALSLVALAPAAARAADPVSQPVTTGPAATTAAAPAPNLWQLGDAISARLDSQWQNHRQLYLDRTRVSIRGNAMMLELHSLAALQNHVGPARQDARIAGLVELLTNAPVYVTQTNTTRTVGNFPHVPAFEASYQANSAAATLHPSADAIVVRALTVAWRARYVANLPEADILQIQAVIHDVAHGTFADLPQHFQPRHLRQLEVQQHQGRRICHVPARVGALAPQVVQRFPAVLRHHHFIGDAGLLQCPLRQRDVARIVFHQKNNLGLDHL